MLSAAGTAEEPKPGTWVAVGYGGRRLVSSDAKEWRIADEWAENGGDDSDNLLGVCYGKGKFVAAGGGTPKRDKAVGGHVLVSDDGKAWRSALSAKFRVHPVLFGGETFVAGGPDRSLLVSDDAQTWKPGGKIAEGRATHFRHGAYGNGRFVFVGNNGGDSRYSWAAVSKDGSKIDGFNGDLPRLRGLATDGRKFVAVGPDGVRLLSADGEAWRETGRAEGKGLEWIVWAGDRFVCGGGGATFASADGATWEAWAKPIPCHVLAVGPGGWVGTSWPGQMWHSPDGLAWAKAAKMPPNGINAAAFVPAAK
jgi:hypothetical protein